MGRTVTLVDASGTALGTADLMEAHTGNGLLHRAFSAYVFRDGRRDLLIQRRAEGKMLWPLTWANTCCSHPFEGESAPAAGERRLREELGFSVPLTPATTFVYRAEDPRGRGVEHEHVTILTGDDPTDDVSANANEVHEWKWVPVSELRADMAVHPGAYAPWLHQGLDLLLRSVPT